MQIVSSVGLKMGEKIMECFEEMFWVRSIRCGGALKWDESEKIDTEWGNGIRQTGVT